MSGPRDERSVPGAGCTETRRSVDGFVAGDLPAPLEARVRQHLCECRACRRVLRSAVDAQRALREALSTDAFEAPAPSGRDGIGRSTIGSSGSWPAEAESVFFDRLGADIVARVRASRRGFGRYGSGRRGSGQDGFGRRGSGRRGRRAADDPSRRRHGLVAAAALFVAGFGVAWLAGGAGLGDRSGGGLEGPVASGSPLLQGPILDGPQALPLAGPDALQPVSFFGLEGQDAAQSMLRLDLVPAVLMSGAADVEPRPGPESRSARDGLAREFVMPVPRIPLRVPGFEEAEASGSASGAGRDSRSGGRRDPR